MAVQPKRAHSSERRDVTVLPVVPIRRRYPEPIPARHHGADPGAPLRVAVLAPIAWRTPPRHYGPWEQFASLLTEGLVACRPPRHPVRHRRLASPPPPCTAPHPPDGRTTRPSIRRSPSASTSPRCSSAPTSSTSSTTASTSCRSPTAASSTRRWSRRSTGSPRRRIVPVYERYDATTDYVAISDADRHPDLHYAATIHHGIDTAAFAVHPAPGDHLLFFGRIHPDKGTAARDRGRPANRAPTRHRRHRPGRAVLPRAGRTARRRRARAVPRSRRRRRASRRARRRARPAAPDRLRRTVRLQRRRSDGVRHPGDRQRPWFDGRTDRPRRHRLPRHRQRGSRRRGRPRRAASTGTRSGPQPPPGSTSQR